MKNRWGKIYDDIEGLFYPKVCVCERPKNEITLGGWVQKEMKDHVSWTRRKQSGNSLVRRLLTAATSLPSYRLTLIPSSPLSSYRQRLITRMHEFTIWSCNAKFGISSETVAIAFVQNAWLLCYKTVKGEILSIIIFNLRLIYTAKVYLKHFFAQVGDILVYCVVFITSYWIIYLPHSSNALQWNL